LRFDHNLVKCRSIFKILLLAGSKEIVYVSVARSPV